MDTFKEIQEKIDKFVEERNWQQFHSPKNLTMSIAIEAAELMEIFQWMTIEDSHKKALYDDEIRAQLLDEVADVLIYCLFLANSANIDLKEAIEHKMERNNHRFHRDETLV